MKTKATICCHREELGAGRALGVAVAIAATVWGAALAQQPLADLLGWQGTRWGMNSVQVEAAVGPGITRMPKPEVFRGVYAHDHVASVDLAGEPFEVLFQMAEKDGTLQQVLIRFKGNMTGAAARPLPVLFASLEDLLTRKYGRAVLHHGNPALGTADATWVFPTTTVELSQLFIKGVVLNLTIRYFPTSKGTENL